MNPNNLTTLANVKGWLGISNTTDDALLTRLISASSTFIQSWLNRRIVSQAYVENRDGMGVGKGRYLMVFKAYPVSAVQSVTIAAQPVPASSDNGQLANGYGFDANALWLAPTSLAFDRFNAGGFEFIKGTRVIQLRYTAGYLVLPYGATNVDQESGLLPPEVATVPSPTGPYTVTTLMTWLSDNGVWYANGTPFTKVTTPSLAGQYSVVDGVYTFNSADAAANVLLSYSYVPPDIEQCCIELIGLRFKEKDRIGQVSKSVGTENITYLQKDMPADVQTLLNQYRRVYDFA